jgi:nucleotide-binding universal stress UspA family protein
MYTDAMRRAFRSLDHFAPRGFFLDVIDNDHFITVRAPEKQFMSLLDEEKRQAVEYMVRVKKALEDNGAIVLLVREGGKDNVK